MQVRYLGATSGGRFDPMGEPERRRRRLRPPSSASAAAEAPATETPGAAPGSDPVIAPETGTTDVESTPTVATTAIEDPDLVEDPAAVLDVAAVLDAAVVADRAVGADPAVVGDPGPRPTRTAFVARPPRVPGVRPTSGAGAGGDDREGERGLRGLVGSGSSQVSVGAALRARDASRPTDAHLAEAEQNLAIVRRNWLPREDLPRNR
jgi:hypothetical protein